MTKVNCRDCSQNDCAYFGMDNKTNCKDFEAKALAAQRQFVGLTDDDIEQEFGFIDELLRDCVHRTEAKLKEKNT